MSPEPGAVWWRRERPATTPCVDPRVTPARRGSEASLNSSVLTSQSVCARRWRCRRRYSGGAAVCVWRGVEAQRGMGVRRSVQEWLSRPSVSVVVSAAFLAFISVWCVCNA